MESIKRNRERALELDWVLSSAERRLTIRRMLKAMSVVLIVLVWESLMTLVIIRICLRGVLESECGMMIVVLKT
jgi:hypothetical protein